MKLDDDYVEIEDDDDNDDNDDGGDKIDDEGSFVDETVQVGEITFTFYKTTPEQNDCTVLYETTVL